MLDSLLKKKEFLLRKNQGKLELENLLYHLKLNNIIYFNIYDLESSDAFVESIKSEEIIREEQEISIDLFVKDVQEILNDNNGPMNYLWVDKSNICGLIKLHKLPTIDNIISLLRDDYFGGYCVVYFVDDNRKVDIDFDESPDLSNYWLYSYKYSKMNSGSCIK